MRLPRAFFVLVGLASGCIWVTQDRYDRRYEDAIDADNDGYASVDWDGDDCDDDDSAINPAASEVCDEVDNDCDGEVDEADAVGATFWYEDVDGDDYGDPDSSVNACEQPSGYVSDNGDCDDLDPDVNPAADEACNDIDDDCDSLTDQEDPDLADTPTWYEDADEDGFGDPDSASTACDQPTGTVEDGTDCDDGDAAVNPDAQEVCDEIDNDCDDLVDDEDGDVSGGSTWYEDADGDGYGDEDSTLSACFQPSGYVEDDTDCDDDDDSVYPGRLENLDNGVDDDCDGDEDQLAEIDLSDSEGVAGPRLAVNDDMLVLAWAAESFEDGEDELFEGRLGLVFDPTEDGLPLVDAWADGDSSSSGTMNASFDFAMADEYWAWATAVESGSQQIHIDVVDSDSGSSGRLTSTVSTSAVLEQIQLTADEDSGVVTAVGCVSTTGPNLFWTGQSASSVVSGSGTATSYTGQHSYGAYNPSQTSFRCEHDPGSSYLYVGLYYPPYLDAYGPSGSSLSQRSRWSYYWGVSDIEISSASGYSHMAVACDDYSWYGCMSDGKSDYAVYLSSYDSGGSASLPIDIPGYDMADIDVAGTSTGEAAICVVSDSGRAWVLLADAMASGSFLEISFDDGTSDAAEECAVAVTDNGELVVAFRYEDEIRAGFLEGY